MRLPGLCLAALLPLATAAVAAPVDTLRDCAAHAGAATRGLAALDRECPGLESALEELGLSTALDGDTPARLSATGVAALAALAERYAGEPPGRAPDAAPVRGIIAALDRQHAAPRSWWGAILEWLRALADRTGTLSWLDRLLGRAAPSAGLLSGVLHALLIAVLGTAFAFVVAELRAAGVFRRRDLRRPPAEEMTAPAVDAAAAALETAPQAERPAILLRLLVEVLRSKGRLQAERQLTHRELIRRASLSNAERKRFARVAGVAEALLYGPEPGPVDAIESVVVDGRALLAELEHSGAAG